MLLPEAPGSRGLEAAFLYSKRDCRPRRCVLQLDPSKALAQVRQQRGGEALFERPPQLRRAPLGELDEIAGV